MEISPEQNVRRRKVFYISGFDPKGPAYYHALYSEEAQKQSRLNGMSIDVGDARRRNRLSTSWRIQSSINRLPTETNYEVLRWDDIMRSRMRRSGPAFYWDTLRTYWLYIHSGALRRILQTSYPAFLAGLYPIVFLAGFFGLAAFAALAGFASAPESIRFADTVWTVPPLVTAALSVGLFVCVLSLSRKLENKVPFYWPLHVYSFTADHMRGRMPEMDARIQRMSQEILDYITQSEDDEILIASHSNGTVVAVLAIAAVLHADPNIAKHGPQISFLTLGHSIPLCSFLPQAKALRRALTDLGGDNGITWVDITAPRDAACFALTDPLKVSGLSTEYSGEHKPKLLSVPLSELFSPQTFRKTLLRRWLRIHFQYLMAYERPTPFDYFLITAGPLTLAKRFAEFPSKDEFAKFRLFKQSNLRSDSYV
ncbi:MAG: hypothetical protein GY948_15740 [Alphaproteobacteria bacterium]|nr:hypothetical protein [Alphaproteobacteria bacterium]